MTSRLLDLPGFPGFYESRLSRIVDYELESFAEYENEKQESAEYHPEEYQPKPLRVNVGAFAWEYVDYRKTEQEMTEDYVTAFNTAAAEYLGFNPGLSLESIERPKFYNFTTDRAFVFVPEDTIARLAEIVRRDRFRSLDTVLRERCTSYDGFCSFYSNRWKDFARKPLASLDHNELALLLSAALLASGAEDDLSAECVEACEEASSVSAGYMDGAMNWPAFEARVAHERAELAAALPEDHPHHKGYIRPCPDTLPLPFGDEPEARA